MADKSKIAAIIVIAVVFLLPTALILAFSGNIGLAILPLLLGAYGLVSGFMCALSKVVEVSGSSKNITNTFISKEGEGTPDAISKLPSVLFKNIAEKSDEKPDHIIKAD